MRTLHHLGARKFAVEKLDLAKQLKERWSRACRLRHSILVRKFYWSMKTRTPLRFDCLVSAPFDLLTSPASPCLCWVSVDVVLVNPRRLFKDGNEVRRVGEILRSPRNDHEAMLGKSADVRLHTPELSMAAI